MGLRFSKMHGLGNDFVIVDCRAAPLALDAAAIRRLGDRHRGVGFDQLLTIEPARTPGAAFAYAIWNRDGSPAGQCGNGLRCVARWLDRAGLLPTRQARLEGPAGLVAVTVHANGEVRADMGEPCFEPARIPLAVPVQAQRYTLEIDGHTLSFGAVSMGNPHAVLEVPSLAGAPVASLGPRIAQDKVFPERCNVGFAQVHARDAIGLRVWERGAGETQACGSGACAAVAVLRQWQRVDAGVRVSLPGGMLRIDWPGPGHPLWMTGPAEFVFEGEWHG